MTGEHTVSGAGISRTFTHGTRKRANAGRFLIRRIGTVGVYWRDTRAGCGQWDSKEVATRYASTRAALPDGGEWVDLAGA